MITVFLDSKQTDIPLDAQPGESLWLSPSQAEQATGWALKPEGLCHGEICVPVPPARRDTFVGPRGVNVAAFWDHMGRPAAHDAAGETWVLGTSARERSEALQSLDAPDFELPDLQGTMHALSDYRGRKVLLVSWASW